MPNKPEKILENHHHAYCMTGNANDARAKLFAALESEWKIKTSGNPDFSYQKFQTLTIDEARNLKESQEKKAFASSGKKIIVIEAETITDQAQNSLLKVLEEPTDNTHFFLLGACVKNLIPTLISRLNKINPEGESTSPDQIEVLEFLKTSLPKRLALVKKLADDIKDEKRTKNEAVILLQNIETILYQNAKKDGKLPAKLFEDLEMCRDYLSDRSASVKMLLEYVALVTPRND